ncbi:recombinase family protein [Amycolatopsis sp. H20-H5]|uniref:recombinase family protein n=1 Tax=Amycolatopsis sp. H20-H5 TaxID=3046309 RepID=UPI002DBCD358|nr:recombinase family protein [Amycolatopsis sp. H20-H5]MEC3974759.1 recombinase family protein [Amycolatopsis sp. H20-H5]
METSQLTGREYLRVSRDRSGQRRSNEQQHGENVQAAKAFGVTLGVPYEDNDRSASRYARKVREDFDRLMTDLETDRFGADHLVLWESSRGSRRVGEWATLVDLLEDRRVKVLVTTHARVYDPANPRDRRSLLEDAVDSEFESAKSHTRAKRDTAAAAAAGRPHGRTPFGFARDYDSKTGRLAGQVAHVENGPLVQEFFDRLDKGHKLKRIAVDWRQRGVVNGRGTPFSAEHLRSMATNLAYVGKRVFDPGRTSGSVRSADAQVIDAEWDQLVEPEVFYRVQRRIGAPDRRTAVNGRARHLVTMTARCGRCDGPIVFRHRKGRDELACKSHGCVRMSAVGVDDYVEDVVLGHLADPKEYGALAQDGEEVGDELKAVRKELAEVDGELLDLEALAKLGPGRGGVSVVFAGSVEPELRRRKAALEGRERELETPAVLRNLLPPGKDVRRRWMLLVIEARREVLRAMCTPEILGTLTIVPAPGQGVQVPVEDRVKFVH